MAGHSQFKNIMYRKGAQDAKRARTFSKLSREITVAARMGGEDPAMNPHLRLAIQEARAANMPKDNITRAIRKASGGGGEAYETVRYEGYASAGVAVLVEALTDNRNRTASDVRAIFSKNGGSLAESGAVSYMFDHVGEIRLSAAAGNAEAVLEAAIDAGAEDVESGTDGHVLRCAGTKVHEVASRLESAFGAVESARRVWRPQMTVSVEEEDARRILRLVDALEENDDVQDVIANFDISDDLMQRLAS